jgi:small subunit ribosomal protein S6e
MASRSHPPSPSPLLLQLNLANPVSGTMKVIECDDEKKLVSLYEKRQAQEVEGDFLGDEYKGYVFRCVARARVWGWALPPSPSLASRRRIRGAAAMFSLRALAALPHSPRSSLDDDGRRRRGGPMFSLRARDPLTPPSPPLLPLPLPRSIAGGNDKQGFPMSQGIMSNGRVRLLMAKGATYYRPRRAGERKRKSVRGCIVGPDLAVLNLVIVTKGEKDIDGLTNAERAPRLGPKRAQKIRSLFNLTKSDDVRKFVIAREATTKKGKKHTKRPKIQRLVTPLALQHKRQLVAAKRTAYTKARTDKAEYERLRAQRNKESRDSALAAKLRRSSRKSSQKA